MGLVLSALSNSGSKVIKVFNSENTKTDISHTVFLAASRDDVVCLRWYHYNTKKGIADLKCPRTNTTLLHVAALNNCYKCVNFLLSIGCSPLTQDGSGEIPLHLAAKTGSNDCLESLTHNKRSLDAQDNWGRTPLLKAIIYNKRTAAYAILEAGCDPSIQDEFGLSPLHVAASYGQKKLLNYLIEAGVDIDVTDKKGRTPLCTAVNGSRFAIVLALLKQGAKTTYGNDQTVVEDAFIKLVHAKSGNPELDARVTSLVISAHGNYLPVNSWGELHLNESNIDTTSYSTILKKMSACICEDIQAGTGIFPFKKYLSKDEEILSLEAMCRDTLRKTMMKTGKNVLWVCDQLDIHPVLKDIILLNSIINY